jgi:GDSL-like Lipase/Acylhydrolase family
LQEPVDSRTNVTYHRADDRWRRGGTGQPGDFGFGKPKPGHHRLVLSRLTVIEPLKVLIALFGLSFAVSASASGAKPPKVVFIGDAITYNWGSAFAANPNWFNRGSAGPPNQNQAYQIEARFQSSVVALHPAIVHILAGTEDIALADDATYATTVQSVQTSIMAMVTQAQNANIQVVLGTIPPLLATDSGSTVPVFQPILTLEVNAWIESYGQANNIPVVNYHDALCLCVGSTESAQSSSSLFTASGTIPSAAGYDTMTALAEAAIATLGLPLNYGYLGNVASPFQQPSPETNATTVPQGTSVQFTAYGVFGHSVPSTMLNTDFSGLNGTWTSSNPSVMYIGYNGAAFAVSPGTTTITYTSPQGIKFTPWTMTVQAKE